MWERKTFERRRRRGKTEGTQRRFRFIHTRMAPTSIFPALQQMYLRGENSEDSLLGSLGRDKGKDAKFKAL